MLFQGFITGGIVEKYKQEYTQITHGQTKIKVFSGKQFYPPPAYGSLKIQKVFISKLKIQL